MRKLDDMAMREVKFDADEDSQGINVHKDYALYEKMKNSAMGQKFDEYKLGVTVFTCHNFFLVHV